MIKTRKKLKNNILKVCVAFLFPFTFLGGVALTNQTTNATTVNSIPSYEESVSVTNSSFESGSTPYATGNSLSGWNAIEEDSTATGMLIDVGSGTNSTPGDDSTTSFSRYQDTYMLQANPGSSGSDSRILMINSKPSLDKTQAAQKGYRSSEITLEANSYYRFSVAVKTSLNGEDNVSASVYVSGIDDANDNDSETIRIGYENLTNTVWKDYFIFIATGDESQTVTLDLYLGSANGARSNGAVFFDEVYINRYSENAFYDLCYDFNYNNEDNYLTYNNQTVFLVDGLQDEKNYLDTTDYNFNFEDDIEYDTNTLGDKWKIVKNGNLNGHVVITNIRDMRSDEFNSLTGGYAYIGDTLSYGNKNAMLLWTDSTGYIGVQSNPIEIKAHQIYKISLKVKVAEISTGSFYLKVQENDEIYNLYPNDLSSDENDSKYYALQSGQTSGITSNVENNFTNDYQTVELYIKGHSLYDSYINLELWLGDSSTNANGCVAIDDIQIEYATYDEFSSASNQVEFTSYSETATNIITNGYFNSTQNANTDDSYPIAASDWTVTKGDENYNESGVIYTYNSDHYKNLYANKYQWAGIYPGKPLQNDQDKPNNIYMMYNSQNSYQSITSTSYSLSSNSYYVLSFDYYNQNASGLKASQIMVEIVDENGITLFKQNGFASAGNWNTAQIYFHTAETVSHNIQVIIRLGTEEENVGGLVYLDNFIINSSDSTAFESARFQVDLTDYYLNLDKDNLSGEISDSAAYNFSVDESYDSNYSSDEELTKCAVGGIVSGNDNPYIDIIPELKTTETNYLVINTKVASSASLTSNFTFGLSADDGSNYYKFTFDLATIFNIGADNASTSEHDCKYGVTINIDGFDTITELVTASELKHFEIYLQCTEATSPTITFTLVSDCDATTGTALISNIDFTSVTANEYNTVELNSKYDDTIFKVNQISTTDDDTSDDDTTEDDNTTTDDSTDTTWLLIPSIIMAVALLVAIIGMALRHVKIKKVEKIKKEAYDRKLAVNHDVILMEAQKRRDAEVEKLQKAKQSFEQQKAQTETDYKAFIRENRDADGKVSKAVEREFKKFNYDISRLEEKIDILKEKIDTVMTAEYLVSIEHKIIAEEEEKFKQDKKEWKNSKKTEKKNSKMKDSNKASNK